MPSSRSACRSFTLTCARSLGFALCAVALTVATGRALAVDPVPRGTQPADAPIDGNATEFFSAQRLSRLPPAQRAPWAHYLARSAQYGAVDRATMAAELRAAGKSEMTPAPYAKGFHLEASMTEAWFKSPEARGIGENVISFQTPSGGWSKRVDMVKAPRVAGESYYSENSQWDYIATIDNDSTTEQLRFLGALERAQPDVRYERAFQKGISYLFAAQFPNGCWPQVYPLRGGYHDAATFNDDAVINALRLLQAVAQGRYSRVARSQQRLAEGSVSRGIECLLAAQIKVGKELTIWGQQHDPLDLSAVQARSYELVGLAGRESATITRFLMDQTAPSPRMTLAVHAAVAWFRAHEIWSYEYDFNTGLRRVEGAGPLWARLSEIETGFSIFSNRDGVKLYDWNRLTDRRQGYAWYGSEPAKVVAAYEAWAAKHPQPSRREF